MAAAAVLTAAVAGGGTAQAAGRCGDHPWCDTSMSADARAQLLLDALTRDEKISLLAGDELFGVTGGAGTHIGTSNGVERVGLPTTYYSDGPVGVRSGQATGCRRRYRSRRHSTARLRSCTGPRSATRPGSRATTSSSPRP